MRNIACHIIAACIAVAFLATVPAEAAGKSVEIRLKDGSRWRGAIEDKVEVTYLEHHTKLKFSGKLIKVAKLYLIVEGHIAGNPQQKTIFRDDIVHMRTIGSEEEMSKPKAKKRRGSRRPGKTDKSAPVDEKGRPLGVFVLPLDGGVGQSFRKEEITEIGEHADTYGPGQTIVLLINSNGGSSLESQYIAEEIFKIRERHRVVAWIKKAISAGCQTAMCCEEIYFMTEGSAGAITTWNPGSGQSIKGQELVDAMEHLAEIARKSGYSVHIANAMKTNTAMCSYTKDPETGEVMFYGDMSGDVVLSDDDSNLSFTSSVAKDCGFSKGTADTGKELAVLLDLPEWHEIDGYGRKIAKKWKDTFERGQKEIQLLQQRRGYWKSSGSAVERLGGLIKINEQLIRWVDRCPNCFSPIPAQRERIKNQLERENAELRRQIANMRGR
ncbi:MAG: hypothetical protein GY715_14130 [Planctomycetes bacterium]|nr:hypothetical protein [Planctomycetota bacterium]